MPSALSDHQLIEVLYDRYAARLYYYAFSLLKEENDAEEALQNLFLGVVRRRPPHVEDWSHYLLGGVRREALKIMRRRKRDCEGLRRLGETALLSPKKEGSASLSQALLLEQALAHLPEEQREVVVLKHYGELVFREIAALLSLSLHTVTSRYRYALEKLRLSLSSQIKD